MRHYLLVALLSLLVLPACQTTTPVTPVEATRCPEATAALRRKSCVVVRNPQPLGVLFAWADGSNLWPKDDDGMVRLVIRFLDGHPTQIKQAMKHIAILDELAPGLEMRRAVGDEASHIRVSFACEGHWSYLGKQAKQHLSEPTLNAELGRWETDEEWQRVFAHEMLHALAFEHEHQHPNNTIAWDREAVYKFYQETQGWDREMVDFQVLNVGLPKQMRTTGYDSTSIMQYPVPQELTLDDFEVAWNTKLSPGDIALLRKLYPAPPS